MLKPRNLFALVVVTALVVLAAAYSLKEDVALPEAGSLVYPKLLDRVNDVSEVDVTARAKTFVLKRADNGWVAPERDGFPVDANKIHELLVGVASLKRIEPTTSNPQLYARLGVEEPDSEKTASLRAVLKTGNGDVVADLIIGEGKPAKGDPTSAEYYVRESGQAQSWLVQGRLPRDNEGLTDWLSRSIVALSGDRLHQVQVHHPDGEEVTVRREKPGDGPFRYVEAPEGVEIKDTWRLNDIGRVLTDLALEDVRTAAAAAGSFPAKPRVVEVRTFDGLVVRMEIADLGEDEHLARLSASFDEAQSAAGAALGSDALLKADEVRKEVEQLNARWSPWVYVIPRYKASYVSKTQADLLPKPETKEPQKPQS
jgi:hypothetical protein